MKEINILNPRKFILAGKAEFTIKNTETGNGYHYKVTKAKSGNIYFVEVKGGEFTAWTYAGFLNDELCFVRGKKGKCTVKDPAIKGLLYALKREVELPTPMFMHHNGRCACCGKRLLDEASIILGYGPVCAKKYLI